MLDTLEPVLLSTGGFFLVALAAKWIGSFFSQYGLPYITGYLLAGMLAGPFILDLMNGEDAENLRYIDELSLAVIAFIAGSELYMKELRNRLNPILLNTAGVVVIAPILIGVALFIATEYISFTQDFSTERRLAVGILGGTILLALSPASTVAVIKEVKARGQFTKTILSITVVMDVVIIVLFAISAAIAGALIDGTGIEPQFVLMLVIDLILAVLLGVAVGNIIGWLMSAASMNAYIKMLLLLVLGWGIFAVIHQIDVLSKDAGFELHLEPLLVAMIGGFYVTNFTQYRDTFDKVLHDVSPLVYVAFFTLTGVALKLDVLVETGLIAVLLFFMRMISIFVGSFIGGTLANEPLLFRKNAWLGLITQAGIALGLAREVAVDFPRLGDSFATLIISVVVLNEIFGPLLLKFALRQVGESNLPEEDQHRALILGIEPQSIALARQLRLNNWDVVLADTNPNDVDHIPANDLDKHVISAITEEGLAPLLDEPTDAVVAMLDNDNENLEAIRIANNTFNVERLIVRLNNPEKAQKFQDEGALIVNPTVAMVTLFDQYVRAPQSAALFMHTDPSYDIQQVIVRNRDVDGLLVRDLRLPSDVLILEIARNNQTLVPNGYTKIRLRDNMTLVGPPSSLQEVAMRLGY
ncbi:MAG: potassium transporter TrkA [Phototrophicales bacterium]|nr:MAG: potassium transporter TrkA [Phototrophicales bacterium]